MITKNQTLELFQFTKPESIVGNANMPSVLSKSQNGAMRVTLALDKRKNIATRLGLAGKDNSGALNERILELSDALKVASVGEFVKLAASPEWTGGRFAISQSKNGKRRASISIVSAARTSAVSEDALVKALASLSEDQQIKLLEKAAALQPKPAEAAEAADVPAEAAE